jgi:hypothetical protein
LTMFEALEGTSNRPNPSVRTVAVFAKTPALGRHDRRTAEGSGETLIEQIAAVGEYRSRWRPTARRCNAGLTPKSRFATGRV